MPINTFDKTQIVTKPKLWQNSSCDKTQFKTKINVWQNLNVYTNLFEEKSNRDTNQIMTKIKSNKKLTFFEKFRFWPKSNCVKKNSYKTQLKTILKFWPNLHCDKTKNVTQIKLCRNLSKTKNYIVTKLKLWQQIKQWQHTNCDRMQIVTKL